MDQEVEIWVPVQGFEGCYEISNLGRIKTLARLDSNNHPKKERIMTLKRKTVYGYPTVRFCRNGKRIYKFMHRLMAIAFIPNPNNYPEVNHINGIKTDYSLSNIEWCTREMNAQHAIKTGLKTYKKGDPNHHFRGKFGETIGNAKLSYKKVKNIRFLYEIEGVKKKYLCSLFGVKRNAIDSIVLYINWNYPEAMPSHRITHLYPNSHATKRS